MPKYKTKEGFFIKDIVIIGEGEHLSGKVDYLGLRSQPIIIDDGRSEILSRTKRILMQINAIGLYALSHYNPYRFTRVTTDEFSFYTRSTPLTLDEYKTIINGISESLKILPPNIILIISSMPVLWPDNTLRNAVLHIQSPNTSGALPIIHHFSKENVSLSDPLYNNASCNNNSAEVDVAPYVFSKDDYLDIYSPDIVLKDSKVMCDDPNQYKSAIIVYGYNLPPIINTIDICYDHNLSVAWNNALALLTMLVLADKKFIPLHISHFITSRTIERIIANLVADAVHADKSSNKIQDSLLIKKEELLLTYFGYRRKAYVFHQTRAEIMHSTHFQSASEYLINTFSISIEYLVDNHNNTLLHQVFLKSKHSEPDLILLKKRFNSVIIHFKDSAINQINKDGNTAFHLAILTLSNTDVDILAKLLTQGARLNIKNNYNMTALEWAYFNNRTQLIENLIKHCINNSIPIQKESYQSLIRLESRRGALANREFILLLYNQQGIKHPNSQNTNTLFHNSTQVFANIESVSSRLNNQVRR